MYRAIRRATDTQRVFPELKKPLTGSIDLGLSSYIVFKRSWGAVGWLRWG